MDFNTRVLEEAANPKHPLLKHLRFVAISASNLNKPYSIQIAGLLGQERKGISSLSPDGRTTPQQLAAIQERTEILLEAQQEEWRRLRGLLREANINVCAAEELSDADRAWLQDWFMDRVFPVLTPLSSTANCPNWTSTPGCWRRRRTPSIHY